MPKILANATKRHKTATDEVHDLDAIIVAQPRRAPLAATHNFPIEFDRDSRGRQIELAD